VLSLSSAQVPSESELHRSPKRPWIQGADEEDDYTSGGPGLHAAVDETTIQETPFPGTEGASYKWTTRITTITTHGHDSPDGHQEL
jgi:hypothetical protein